MINSKSRKIIFGFILWPLIIAIIQFNLNYQTGLLNGKLKYGEIPDEVFLGLFSGLFGAFVFWGLAIILAKIISLIAKKEFKGSTIFFIGTLFFFSIFLITQTKSLYDSLSLNETKVKEAREMVKKYEAIEESKGK